MADDKKEAWIGTQKRTFTKWANSHLVKKRHPALNTLEDDFDTGINLMNLVNALYGVDIPKHNKDPKARPFKLDNITLALDMLENKAKVKTNFLKGTHLADHDLKMILGMIWAIILDYQIKGISVEELTAKEGLLLWCQKKTAGYERVKIDNFSTSWVNGLGFCALIHRHRPDLLDYHTLDKDNARKCMETAFEVAEKQLGIARLLEPEDLLDQARPDERAVMTYISEFFHCFASSDLKEKAAARVQKFTQFQMAMKEQQNEYEQNSQNLLSWIEKTIASLQGQDFGSTSEEAQSAFRAHKEHLSKTKIPYITTKLDNEANYAQIQTKLTVYDRNAYQPPQGLSPEEIDQAWARLEEAEKKRGAAVRDNMFRFIEKSQTAISPEQVKEFEASFNHFDKDGSGSIDKVEFRAALSALSIDFKTDDAFNKLFGQVAEGNDKISKDQFVNYMISLNEEKDTKDAIKSAFASMADGADTIAAPQLKIHPLQDTEVHFLENNLPPASDRLDYANYTDQVFKN